MTAAEDIFGRNEDMIFVSHYDSPLGMIYMAADEDVLKGVWFEGQKYFASGLKENGTEEGNSCLEEDERVAGSLFRRKRSEVSSAAGAGGLRIPEKGMEDPAYDPVWKDHDIRGDRQESR